MQFLLILILITVVGLWIFNATARGLFNAGVLNTLSWIGSHIPTIGTILVIIFIIVMLPIILGISWVAIWVTIMGWTAYPLTGWIIGIGGILMFIAGLRWFIKPLIIISLILVLFSICFPLLNGALNRYSQGSQKEWVNALDSATLQKQPLGVTTGVVIKDAILRDENGVPTSTIAKTGKKIKTMSLEGKQFKDSPDVFVYVMIEDANEEFVSGKRGWIARDKVQLGNEESPPPLNTPPNEEKTAKKGDYIVMFTQTTASSQEPTLHEGNWQTTAPISITTADGELNETNVTTFTLGARKKVRISTSEKSVVFLRQADK